MIRYVNKLKVENISEFYIMISLYEYFLIKPLCLQMGLLKRHFKKIF